MRQEIVDNVDVADPDEVPGDNLGDATAQPEDSDEALDSIVGDSDWLDDKKPVFIRPFRMLSAERSSSLPSELDYYDPSVAIFADWAIDLIKDQQGRKSPHLPWWYEFRDFALSKSPKSIKKQLREGKRKAKVLKAEVDSIRQPKKPTYSPAKRSQSPKPEFRGRASIAVNSGSPNSEKARIEGVLDKASSVPEAVKQLGMESISRLMSACLVNNCNASLTRLFAKAKAG